MAQGASSSESGSGATCGADQREPIAAMTVKQRAGIDGGGVGGEFQFLAENQRFARLALRAILT
jgi:hypothetical protein